MATVIRLDKSALEYLFEKLGDEFVLELRAAALKEAIGARIGVLVNNEYEKQTEKFIKEEIKKQIGTVKWGGNVLLQQELHDAVSRIVARKVESIVYKALDKIDVEDRVNKITEYVMGTMEHKAFYEMRQRVAKYIDDLVDTEIRLRQK